MSIQVDTVRVAGFRGLNNIEISLPRVAILIGANNSGKTSLLKAIALVLGDYSRFVSEEDFHIGSDEKKAEQILVDVRIIATKDELREKKFSEEWATEFGDSIKAEADGSQYIAVRVRCSENPVKGAYVIERAYMDKWPELKTWTTDKVKLTSASRFENISFLPIEAQRDIHSELRTKTSYVGRVLSGIEYKKDVVESIEKQIKELNEEAVNKSDVLKGLKTHLEHLNRSFDGSGKAEVTPFPRKIRDLSKNFSVHIGEPNSGTFPMEYHGMGTRSWASMLTVKAFAEMLAEKHQKEVAPFFSVMAAEEPEAHLHPSAQKAIYRQLESASGQVIVSTHSPYLASIAQVRAIRYLSKVNGQVVVKFLTADKQSEDERKIQREIIHSRGELLFCKAMVLCEGETEEQALPILFSKYFGCEPFELGISFVGIGGSGKYGPFFRLAKDFEIPFYVFSDGERQTVDSFKKTYEEVFTGLKFEDFKNSVFLDGNDFEGYLLADNLLAEVEAAISSCDGNDALQSWITRKNGTHMRSKKSDKPPCVTCKQSIFEGELRNYYGEDGKNRAVLDYIRSNKTKIAPVLAEEICKQETDSWPAKITELFKKIKEGAGLT
jgi:putative ATP-dependent endonuclease of OLD family